MKPTAIIIGILVAALVASNAWWLYSMIDAGITATYRDQSLDEQREALDQLTAVLPVVASSGGKRDLVLAAARQTAGAGLEFEKEGFVWIGRLGYRFNANGTLVEVETNP